MENFDCNRSAKLLRVVVQRWTLTIASMRLLLPFCGAAPRRAAACSHRIRSLQKRCSKLWVRKAAVPFLMYGGACWLCARLRISRANWRLMTTRAKKTPKETTREQNPRERKAASRIFLLRRRDFVCRIFALRQAAPSLCVYSNSLPRQSSR